MQQIYKNIKVLKLDHYGRGIAKIDNKITFINNALPDEIVDLIITKNNKNILEADVIKYHNYATNRVNSKCPYYLECGGCDLMHLDYQSQLEFKEQKIKEIMYKFALIEPSLIKPIIGINEYNYRNKVTLQVKENIGFYKKKSYDIIPVDNCLISDNKINKIINILKNINNKNINQIIIKASLNTNDIMVIIDTFKKINDNDYISNLPNINIIKKVYNQFITIQGNSYITEYLDKYKFNISSESFFQVNTNGALNLYKQVLKYADLTGKERVLDLYCGTGTIGIFLAEKTKEVLGIELNKQAIIDANINKELNNIQNIRFEVGDTADVLEKNNFIPDIIVIDPPRSGLNTKTINEILKLNPTKIIYVSCDPVTLARDLKIFKEKYNIVEITPFDMFPNSHHVETVVLIEKKY